MRTVTFPAPGVIEVRETAAPEPLPGQVLVEVAACGLCTTDIEILGGRFWGNHPIVPGHEVAGVVREVGPDVVGLAEGDRVAVDPNIPCGSCAMCVGSSPHLCPNLRAIGVTEPGGFADFMTAPASNVYRLPDEADLESSALAEPLACVLHGVDRAQVRPDDMVAIHGSGFIGLLFALLLRRMGVRRIALIDPLKEKREAAVRLDFNEVLAPSEAEVALSSHDTDRPSLSIDCSGAPEAVETALETTRPGGRVLLFGVADPAKRVGMSPYEVFRRELTILGSFVNPFTHPRAVDLLPQLDLENLITHRFDLGAFAAAVDVRKRDPSALKILILPREGGG